VQCMLVNRTAIWIIEVDDCEAPNDGGDDSVSNLLMFIFESN